MCITGCAGCQTRALAPSAVGPRSRYEQTLSWTGRVGLRAGRPLRALDLLAHELLRALDEHPLAVLRRALGGEVAPQGVERAELLRLVGAEARARGAADAALDAGDVVVVDVSTIRFIYELTAGESR